MHPQQFQTSLLAWFDRYGRKDLPWQKNVTPYRVWVSEIMLQQTQVATVKAYFQRFIEKFPTLQALAQAPLDDVLQLWAGLGYYARARNLHRSAIKIVEMGGDFPTTFEDIIDLPGVGRSTAGAILSIACQQHYPILDGNVKRVLTRFHGISGWPGQSAVEKELWALSTAYTPKQRTADYTQAMMDLGATLCVRSRPQCLACPLITHCHAYQHKLTASLPTSRPKKHIPIKTVFFLVLSSCCGTLLYRRPATGIWGGLWSLPEFASVEDIQRWCYQKNMPISSLNRLQTQRHTFSHYHLDYSVIIAKCDNPNNNVMEEAGLVWYKASQFNELGLPAPIKRILQAQTHIGDCDDKNGEVPEIGSGS